jgi:hypothetical protein
MLQAVMRLVGTFALLLVAVWQLRKREGSMTIMRAFVYGLLIGATAGLVAGAHDAVFYQAIDPGYSERVISAQRDKLLLERADMVQRKPQPVRLIAEVDQALAANAKAKEAVAQYPNHVGRILLGSVSSTLLTCGIYALIAGFLLRGLPDAQSKPLAEDVSKPPPGPPPKPPPGPLPRAEGS